MCPTTFFHLHLNQSNVYISIHIHISTTYQKTILYAVIIARMAHDSRWWFNNKNNNNNGQNEYNNTQRHTKHWWMILSRHWTWRMVGAWSSSLYTSITPHSSPKDSIRMLANLQTGNFILSNNYLNTLLRDKKKIHIHLEWPWPCDGVLNKSLFIELLLSSRLLSHPTCDRTIIYEPFFFLFFVYCSFHTQNSPLFNRKNYSFFIICFCFSCWHGQ